VITSYHEDTSKTSVAGSSCGPCPNVGIWFGATSPGGTYDATADVDATFDVECPNV